MSLAPVPADAVLVRDLAWTDACGAPVDREVVLATAGSHLGGLLDLPRAVVEVTAHRAPDGDWLVDVVHRSGPVVVGLRVDDARPVAAPGWAVVDADPRPLLPGGRARFRVHWRSAAGPLRVRVESWNSEPVDLDEESVR